MGRDQGVQSWREGLISKELFHRVPGFVLPAIRAGLGRELPLRHFEVLAKVRHVLVEDRFRAPVPALMRETRFITDAVQAHLQICSALVACFGPARLAWECELPTALVAMTCHEEQRITPARRLSKANVGSGQAPVIRTAPCEGARGPPGQAQPLLQPWVRRAAARTGRGVHVL